MFARWAARAAVVLSRYFFSYDETLSAWHRLQGASTPLTPRARMAWLLMRLAGLFLHLPRLAEQVRVSRPLMGYSGELLHLRLNRVFDMPEVVVAPHRPATVNVLVPGFSVDTISAGFFGVFALARQLAVGGLHTRLVLFDNFAFYEDQFRAALKVTPGLTDLLEKVELAYIGAREKPLQVSAQDVAVATVWYSAYFAEKIRVACGARRFLYLVQDYEPAFHPHGSQFVLAHASYELPAIPIFSTRVLRDDFTARGLYPGQEWQDWCCFDNAIVRAPNVAAALAHRRATVTRRFVFYSRPGVDRNMFDLGALAIIEACRQGVFDNGRNWKFFGMGIGMLEIYLNSSTKLEQLPRMSLDEYVQALSGFDVGLSLMASAHPSITPVDLAAAGVPVVTNSFGVKQASYFAAISPNIICAGPLLEDLVAALREAVRRSEDMEARLHGAEVDFPQDWDQTWTKQHREFLARSVAQARAPAAAALEPAHD